MMLDLESVRLFVLTADYGSLTRAAEVAGTVQPAVSTRLKALEAGLGRKLLERTPRYVRLTADGSLFLERARDLLAAHDAAIAAHDTSPVRLVLGVSDHALGTSFDKVLGQVRAALPPASSFALRVEQSAAIRADFEAGEIDLAVIRREGSGADGEVLGEDQLAWRVPDHGLPTGASIPLVMLPEPCGVRAVAIKALDRAGLAWHEAFVGGSCLALIAAVRAGLGIAALGRMIGADLGEGRPASGLPLLPPLPTSQIVMLARATNPAETAAARALAASVRGILKRPAL